MRSFVRLSAIGALVTFVTKVILFVLLYNQFYRVLFTSSLTSFTLSSFWNGLSVTTKIMFYLELGLTCIFMVWSWTVGIFILKKLKTIDKKQSLAISLAVLNFFLISPFISIITLITSLVALKFIQDTPQSTDYIEFVLNEENKDDLEKTRYEYEKLEVFGFE